VPEKGGERKRQKSWDARHAIGGCSPHVGSKRILEKKRTKIAAEGGKETGKVQKKRLKQQGQVWMKRSVKRLTARVGGASKKQRLKVCGQCRYDAAGKTKKTVKQATAPNVKTKCGSKRLSSQTR